ncbi:hypothetical protein Ciccas_012644 [Cichlidogyrus casuarinus]|uniref:Uncharacterized protein n=1 Tax=Cichlidogyrus casuarinus TaxID=1844966 RepID=A0ABD2PMU0_9PLAT
MTSSTRLPVSDTHELDRLLHDLHTTSRRLAEGRPPAPVRSPAIGRASIPTHGPLSGNSSRLDNLDSSKAWNTSSSYTNRHRRIQVTPGGSTTSTFYSSIPRQSSVDRHQTAYSTNLERGPSLTSPVFGGLRGSEIHLTIDPQNGISNISQDSQAFSRSRHANFGSRSSFQASESERERRLMEELMTTKEELKHLRSSMNTLHQDLNSSSAYSVGVTVPSKNRHFQSQMNIHSGCVLFGICHYSPVNLSSNPSLLLSSGPKPSVERSVSPNLRLDFRLTLEELLHAD